MAEIKSAAVINVDKVKGADPDDIHQYNGCYTANAIYDLSF